MKLAGIQISNFLGAYAIDLKLTKPVALIAGKNYAGKSSVQEAVRMALTGETVRVGLKKDYGNLISEGQESGFAEVSTVDRSFSVVLPSGKGEHSDSSTLNYVLDAQRFSSLDDNTRRSFLFGLCGIKLDGSAVKQRLIDKGCNAAKVEQTAPLLRAGFDAAAKESANKARDAKASWKTATGGETWGKDKAPKWQPAALPAEAEKAQTRHDNAKAKLIEADKELTAAQQELGAVKAEQTRQHQAEARRMELHELAGRAERIQTKLNLDQSEVAAWEQKVADCKAKAGVDQPDPKAPGEFLLRGLASVTDDFLTLTCEYANVDWPAELTNRAAAHLAEYKKLHGWPHRKDVPDQEAIAKLPEYENALALLRRSVANGQRDLAASLQAAETLKGIDGMKANANTDEAEAKVADLKGKRDAWAADVQKYRDIADQYGRRTSLMLKASLLHADVMEWTEISDALSPDGIPAELLSDALGPINERLAKSGNDAQWKRINIGSDMNIYAAEEGEQPRDYALLSESEKWRADAMIAEAISYISGTRLLVLDRFDVLDMKGREDALYWLDELVESGDIDSALIFGTLKALPAQLLPSIEGFWIENGIAGEMRKAA